MARKVLRGLALSALGSISAGAFAQQTPVLSDIDCARSKMAVPAGLRCQATQNFSGFPGGWQGDAGGTYRTWTASGAPAGVQLLYLMTEVTSMDVGLNPSVTLQDLIRSEMADGKEARDFSALANRGGADFMTFTAATGDSCVGVRRYGPTAGVGYQWILSAVRCEPRGRATTEADIDRFIAGATVRGS